MKRVVAKTPAASVPAAACALAFPVWLLASLPTCSSVRFSSIITYFVPGPPWQWLWTGMLGGGVHRHLDLIYFLDLSRACGIPT